MKIAKLEPSKRVKGRWLVWLDDGSLLRCGEHQVADFSLYVGLELSESDYEKLSQAASREAVRGKALDLVSARPLSRRELVEKLTARPRDREKQPFATPEQAEEAADFLEKLGYLDDAEYARTVARHYSAKGFGARKIRDELYRRGVPREHWDEALECAAPPEDGVDEFLRKRFKGEAPDQKELKRASDALARRGFRWDEIKAGLARYGADTGDE